MNHIGTVNSLGDNRGGGGCGDPQKNGRQVFEGFSESFHFELALRQA